MKNVALYVTGLGEITATLVGFTENHCKILNPKTVNGNLILKNNPKEPLFIHRSHIIIEPFEVETKQDLIG